MRAFLGVVFSLSFPSTESLPVYYGEETTHWTHGVLDINGIYEHLCRVCKDQVSGPPTLCSVFKPQRWIPSGAGWPKPYWRRTHATAVTRHPFPHPRAGQEAAWEAEAAHGGGWGWGREEADSRVTLLTPHTLSLPATVVFKSYFFLPISVPKEGFKSH